MPLHGASALGTGRDVATVPPGTVARLVHRAQDRWEAETTVPRSMQGMVSEGVKNVLISIPVMYVRSVVVLPQ